MKAAEDTYDRGAQVERTVLAWNRSALAVGANGGLLVHEGFVRTSVPLVVLGFAIVGIGAVVWALSTDHYPLALAKRTTHLLGNHRGAIFATAAFVSALSLIDLVLVSTA